MPFVSVPEVSVIVAVMVVGFPCATGFGEADAELVNTGGTVGVADTSPELALVPAELLADTT